MSVCMLSCARRCLQPLPQLALLLAGLLGEAGHPGLTSGFLVTADHPIALRHAGVAATAAAAATALMPVACPLHGTPGMAAARLDGKGGGGAAGACQEGQVGIPSRGLRTGDRRLTFSLAWTEAVVAISAEGVRGVQGRRGSLEMQEQMALRLPFRRGSAGTVQLSNTQPYTSALWLLPCRCRCRCCRRTSARRRRSSCSWRQAGQGRRGPAVLVVMAAAAMMAAAAAWATMPSW